MEPVSLDYPKDVECYSIDAEMKSARDRLLQVVEYQIAWLEKKIKWLLMRRQAVEFELEQEGNLWAGHGI
jgi:hypothetical protein